MKIKKIFNFALELLVCPFILLFRTANVIPNPNKTVKIIAMFFISIIVVTIIILYVYREVIFK